MKEVLTGLIGHPVGHSLSPLIHNYWIKQYGLRGSYKAIDVPGETLKQNIDSLRDEGYAGFNVTIPYKQDIFRICDRVDEMAQKIGAVNLVVIEDSGALSGFNTDTFGFVENIKEAVPDFSFHETTALVLGAGGAARAVCFGLKQAGVACLYIANRTKGKAEDLAISMGGQAVDWDIREQAADGVDIIINTTSLGMNGNPPLSFGFEDVKREGVVVCDIIYMPQETGFMQKAKEKGCSVVGGMGMLLHQARPSFKAWYGIMPDITEELRYKVTEAL